MENKRPFTVWILMILVAFQGISGILGGIGLMMNPTGEPLGIPQAWLEGSVFEDYMIPGIILFSVLGLYPLMIFGGLWKRNSWAWPGTLVLGIALVIWIAVEILIIGYHSNPPLQLIYGVIGILIIGLVYMPTVKSFYLKEIE